MHDPYYKGFRAYPLKEFKQKNLLKWRDRVEKLYGRWLYIDEKNQILWVKNYY